MIAIAPPQTFRNVLQAGLILMACTDTAGPLVLTTRRAVTRSAGSAQTLRYTMQPWWQTSMWSNTRFIEYHDSRMGGAMGGGRAIQCVIRGWAGGASTYARKRCSPNDDCMLSYATLLWGASGESLMPDGGPAIWWSHSAESPREFFRGTSRFLQSLKALRF